MDSSLLLSSYTDNIASSDKRNLCAYFFSSNKSNDRKFHLAALYCGGGGGSLGFQMLGTSNQHYLGVWYCLNSYLDVQISHFVVSWKEQGNGKKRYGALDSLPKKEKKIPQCNFSAKRCRSLYRPTPWLSVMVQGSWCREKSKMEQCRVSWSNYIYSWSIHLF